MSRFNNIFLENQKKPSIKKYNHNNLVFFATSKFLIITMHFNPGGQYEI